MTFNDNAYYLYTNWISFTVLNSFDEGHSWLHKLNNYKLHGSSASFINSGSDLPSQWEDEEEEEEEEEEIA